MFIGGAIAPLLQTHPAMPRVRATDDVDAIVGSTSYTDHHRLDSTLVELGFTRHTADATHVRRWHAPDGAPFDLIPIGDHLGGTGNRWDLFAIQTAISAEIESGLTIRHASAPGFLALKWAAFRDRGRGDPFSSRDLEDILALAVSRDALVPDFRKVPADIQAHIRGGFRWLIDSADYDDLVAAHLGSAQSFKQTAALLRQRIDQIVGE